MEQLKKQNSLEINRISDSLVMVRLNSGHVYDMEKTHEKIVKEVGDKQVLPKNASYFLDIVENHGAFGVFDEKNGTLAAMIVCHFAKSHDDFYPDYVNITSLDVKNICFLESMVTLKNYRKISLQNREDYSSTVACYRGKTLAEILVVKLKQFALENGRNVCFTDVDFTNFPSLHVLHLAGFAGFAAFQPPEDIKIMTLVNHLDKDCHIVSPNKSDYAGFKEINFGIHSYSSLQHAFYCGLQTSALLKDHNTFERDYFLEKSLVGDFRV